jgi:hypothetical protein
MKLNFDCHFALPSTMCPYHCTLNSKTIHAQLQINQIGRDFQNFFILKHKACPVFDLSVLMSKILELALLLHVQHRPILNRKHSGYRNTYVLRFCSFQDLLLYYKHARLQLLQKYPICDF